MFKSPTDVNICHTRWQHFQLEFTELWLVSHLVSTRNKKYVYVSCDLWNVNKVRLGNIDAVLEVTTCCKLVLNFAQGFR